MTRRLLASGRVLATSASLLLFLLAPAGCDDDGGRRAIGAVCSAPSQCVSGICSEQTCIDPFSCVQALAENTEPAFVAACAASLSELAITPNPAQVEPGGSVQLTVTGALTSTTTGDTGRVAPRPDGGSDLEPTDGEPTDRGAGDGGFGEGSGALTAAIDVTAASRFESSNPEAIFFDPETPGLLEVRGIESGSFTVMAFIGSGDAERMVEGTLVVGEARVEGGGDAGGADRGEGDLP